MIKIYLGGAMFTSSEIDYNLNLTKKLRENGFIVYCPNENMSINDKKKTSITPEMIYMADIVELEDSNIFICQISNDIGTMWEAGYMDCLSKKFPEKYWGCIGLCTDIRLQTKPNPALSGVDNQTFYINGLVIGGLKLSLGVFLNEGDMINKLVQLKSEGKQYAKSL